MAANPMYQFNVYRIGPEIKIGEIDLSFTNASLFMVISSLAILIIFNLGAQKKNIIPDKIQLLSELSYTCLLYTSPSPRDLSTSRMPSSA